MVIKNFQIGKFKEMIKFLYVYYIYVKRRYKFLFVNKEMWGFCFDYNLIIDGKIFIDY